jgi:hypothetical protein
MNARITGKPQTCKLLTVTICGTLIAARPKDRGVFGPVLITAILPGEVERIAERYGPVARLNAKVCRPAVLPCDALVPCAGHDIVQFPETPVHRVQNDA